MDEKKTGVNRRRLKTGKREQICKFYFPGRKRMRMKAVGVGEVVAKKVKFPAS